MDKNEASKLNTLLAIASIDITLELDRILHSIMEITCFAMNAHSGTMMLVDETNGELKTAVSHGLGHDHIERFYEAARKAGVKLASGPQGTAIKTGKCCPVPNIFEEPGLRPWHDLSKELGFSSQIFAPLKKGTATAGMMSIHWAKPHQFTDDEINFVKDAASHAAIVIHNSQTSAGSKNQIKELRGSEGKYRNLFENANDSFYIHDAEGYFIELNDAALRLVGCTREEIIGTNVSNWITPESLRTVERCLQAGLSGGPDTQQMTVEIICKNGGTKWVEIKRRLVKDGDRITAIHGIGRDITEKRKMEQQLQATNEKLIKSYEELKEAEEKYRDLFVNAEDPMYTLDTEGYFQTINKAGLKILGCTKEEVIGTHISKWLTPESLVVSQEVLKKQISGENMDYPVSVEVICKNKERRWGEIRTRYIKYGNRITGVHGIARDVTEKKRLEMQLKDYNEKLARSCEELIEADRIKTEFVSKITHELLTPLTSIKGFTELLREEMSGDMNDGQKRKMDIIYRNTEKLIGLIKELIDVAHLEKNKFGLHFGLVSLNDIIARSINDIDQQAKEKDISIIRNIKKLPAIWGDEGRLSHVMTNLLNNAIKFTPSKGTVTIKAVEDAKDIKISVTDTGIGIPEDKLMRIFEKFYQIDGSSNRRYGGAGLGLSICKSIIENHYGSIWADSTGCGSTFNIVLPKLAHRKNKGM